MDREYKLARVLGVLLGTSLGLGLIIGDSQSTWVLWAGLLMVASVIGSVVVAVFLVQEYLDDGS